MALGSFLTAQIRETLQCVIAGFRMNIIGRRRRALDVV